MTANPLAQTNHPFYGNPDEIVVTRGLDPVAALPCERIPLPREQGWPTHHIGGHVGRTADRTQCTLAPAALGRTCARSSTPSDGPSWRTASATASSCSSATAVWSWCIRPGTPRGRTALPANFPARRRVNAGRREGKRPTT